MSGFVEVGASLAPIVMLPAPSAMLALLGLLRLRENFSTPSGVASFLI
jgi:hypothetical protein